MSNNKQSMKLYTEGQVRDMLFHAKDLCENFITYEEVLKTQTPIELPSDEEIDKKFGERITMYDLGYTDGIKYLRDKIQGGNK